jgi:hypothetical protein
VNAAQVRADAGTAGEGGRGGGEGRGGEGGEGREVRPSGRECFILGNFRKDATVRPCHGRPRGHRPTVRLSVRRKTSA